MTRGRIATSIAILAAAVTLVACPAADPAPTPPTTSIVSFQATATTIERGDSIALTWLVQNPGTGTTDRPACSIGRRAENEAESPPFAVSCTGTLTEIPVAPTTSSYIRYQLNVLKRTADANDPYVTQIVTIDFGPTAESGDTRWTRQFGTDAVETAYDVATDASGNVYVAGYTSGDLEGANAGGNDAFVRSYNADGELRWTRQFGTSSAEIALGVAVDASGNVYATGYTGGALEGAGTGGIDAFLRSYDGNGNLRWTRQFGTGTGSGDIAYSVATDASGNVYVAGEQGGAAGGVASPGSVAFVRSYASNGNLRWTDQFGALSGDQSSADVIAYRIATDPSGNVYVAGDTSGALEGVNAGGNDAFLRSYDGNGNVRWTLQFGTSSDDNARGVGTDANGHVYVAGNTSGNLAGTNAGNGDVFVRSYDGNGNLRWTRQFGTSSLDYTFDAAVDVSGRVYVAGYTAGVLGESNAGDFDVFVRSFDGDGETLWTRQFGTTNYDIALGVGAAADSVYVIGRTDGVLEGSSAGINAFIRAFVP